MSLTKTIKSGLQILVFSSILAFPGCSSTTRYEGITLEGYPIHAEFQKSSGKGEIRIGPYNGISIHGKYITKDKNSTLDNLKINHPEDYPVNMWANRTSENMLPKEHPLSKYSSEDALQDLYDKIRTRN